MSAAIRNVVGGWVYVAQAASLPRLVRIVCTHTIPGNIVDRNSKGQTRLLPRMVADHAAVEAAIQRLMRPHHEAKECFRFA